MREVLWHLPGLFMNIDLYERFIPYIYKNPHALHDGYTIHTVYGSFPNAIWNGGRSFVGKIFCIRDDVEEIVDFYKKYGIKISLTWTNSKLRKEHLFDAYCNMITELCHENGNYVITAEDLMFDYIKERYPKYQMIASVTRERPDDNTFGINNIVNKYDIVVLHQEFNEDLLKSGYLSLCKNRIEVIVNQACKPWCEYTMKHYDLVSEAQLEFRPCDFLCPHKHVYADISKVDVGGGVL